MGIIDNPVLEAFRITAQKGSVHAAAVELGLTQTAVTKRIQALEEELSLTLFTRSRRGMQLTEDGTVLLQYCRAIGDLGGALKSQLHSQVQREVALTIVGPTSAISTRVVECCMPVYRKFPALRLHLQSDDHEDRVDLVRRGLADFAIVPPADVPNEMDSKMLRPDRYLLVGSSKWKGRRLPEILEQERIIDFYESDPTTRNYLRTFGLEARAKRARIFANENEALVRLIASGVGYGTLTESVARTQFERGVLVDLNRGKAMEDPLALVWYPRRHPPNYFAELIRAVR